MFKRRQIILSNEDRRRAARSAAVPATTAPRSRLSNPSPEQHAEPSECSVLIVNASHEMAREMTRQLTQHIPHCVITYAPTIAVASWLVSKHRIDLVVSSPLLPDGGIERLQRALAKRPSPPDLVVVGNMTVQNAERWAGTMYECTAFRRYHGSSIAPRPASPPSIARPSVRESSAGKVDQKVIKNLGADIRNDLNNPLQEIVAMVFVAQAGARANPATAQALQAIEQTAKNMASIVNSLEDKIREAVATPPVR